MGINVSMSVGDDDRYREKASITVSWLQRDARSAWLRMTEDERMAINRVGLEGVRVHCLLRGLAKMLEEFEADDPTISAAERDDLISRIFNPDLGAEDGPMKPGAN